MTGLNTKNRPDDRFFKAAFGRDVLTVSEIPPNR
jgi:hypothetical protein